MRFSKREIRLIILLAVVVIFAAIYFGANYVVEKTDAYDKEYEEVKSQADYIRMTISNADSVKSSISESENKITAVSEAFLPVMTPEDADRYITGFAVRNGATPMILEISPLTYAAPAYYAPNSTEALSSTAVSGDICMYTTDFTCTSASKASLQNIIDEINAEQSLRIESFSIVSSSSEVVLSMTVSIYMLNA